MTHRNEKMRNGDFTMPGLNKFKPSDLVHGEENIFMYAPLKTGTSYNIQERVLDIIDKNGKATLLKLEGTVSDPVTNELVAKNVRSLFIKNIGGFGYSGSSTSQEYPSIPER